MKVQFVSTAELELKEAMDFYESAQQGLGAKFLGAVEAATRLIESHPLWWSPMSPRTRRCRISRFPFGLIDQVRGDEVLIVSVMDLRRDPKRWEHYL